MRLDHLLSKEEEVRVLYTVESSRMKSQMRECEEEGAFESKLSKGNEDEQKHKWC